MNFENNELTKEYKLLYRQTDDIYGEFINVKKEYDEICLLEIGKGKYYKITQKPITIAQRIVSLENDRYDHYRRHINEEKIKEIDSLLPILKEDLEKSQKELEEFENSRKKIIEEYNEKSKIYKEYKKRLKEIENIINKNNKRIKFLIKRIKYIERNYDKCKYINPKKLNLKKYNK